MKSTPRAKSKVTKVPRVKKQRYYRLTDKQYENMMKLFADHGIPKLSRQDAEHHVARKSEDTRAALLQRLGNE